MTGLARTRSTAVLVVDDQTSVRIVLARLLRALGVATVDTAADGAEAIRVLTGAVHPFDLILCDLSMPGDDGLVLLRNLARLDRPPAVALMSGKDMEVLETARRIGIGHGLRMLESLTKPIAATVLAGLLDRVSDAASPYVTTPLPALSLADIRAALESEAIELHYQPQYDLASGRICGFEALVRLRHEEFGLVSPDRFIGVVEAEGLIGSLTDRVLDQAAGQAAAFRAAGWAVTVSVNLSAAVMDDLELPERAKNVCARRGIPPASLVFELTESMLAEDAAVMRDILARLRLKGFRLSLDDFGTGHASLDQLRELPFHELKLDRRFVRDAVHHTRSRLILEGSLRLASELKLSSVAEGVETEEMLDLVAARGCDVVQGALVAMPMPAEVVPPWLAEADWVRRIPKARASALESAQSDHQDPSGGRPHAPGVLSRLAHDLASPLLVANALVDLMERSTPAADPRHEDLGSLREALEEIRCRVAALRASVERS